jgi:IS5 family transposase
MMIHPETPLQGRRQLFQTQSLADTLRQDHPLIILAKKINWCNLIDQISKFYNEKIGRACLPIRLMIGLLLLKYIFDLSDAELVANWEENIYYQAFTGQGSFTQKRPCDSSQLTLFRKRIKKEGCELIFAESVRIHGKEALEKNCIVDTTVQEKNITFPTEFKLILKAINFIKKIAEFLKVTFSKSYTKEIKTLRNLINFSKGKLAAEMKTKAIVRLRTIANTLYKNLVKQLPAKFMKVYKIANKLMILKKIINQNKNDEHKIYSLHEPQVKCVAKGKSDKKYEFGSKVSFIVSKSKLIILGALNIEDNKFDGDTLQPAIDQLGRLHNGYKPETLVGDRGYRGRSVVKGVKIVTPYDREKGILCKISRIINKLLKRRSSIEPIIGHLKNDHKLSRNFLKGTLGDTINPILAAAAFNLVKFSKLEHQHLHKYPKPLNIYIKPRRKKFTDLPIWREDNPLF